jgi:hypothetical protein
LADGNRRSLSRPCARDRPYERLDITGVKGLTDGQKLALKTMGAVEHLSNP